MTQSVYIAASVLVGCGAALQVALLGAMARERGPMEAAWVSLLATVTVLALVLALRATGGSGLALPWPFDRAAVLVLIAVVTGALLGLALRGLPPYFAASGALAVPFLLGASFLGPRLGIGLFLGAVIAGQLGAGVVLDHVGAFGAQARHVDPARIAGVVALLVGVVLVRGLRWG
jgi:transporter family-2 protein